MIQRERDRGLALAMEGDDLREIDVRQRVAGDHDEGVVESVADLTDGSAGAERRFLDAVLQAHADRAAIAEAVLDLRREVLQGHERVADPVALEEVEDVSEAWLIDDRDHRLGPIDRQGAQAAPLAAGHDHGLHQIEFSAREGTTSRRTRGRSLGAATALDHFAASANSLVNVLVRSIVFPLTLLL